MARPQPQDCKLIKVLIDTVKQHPRYATAIGLVAIYALLGFFLAPYLLEKNLVETMQRDFDAELRVDNIEVNPFSLTLRIQGLELDNPAGEPTLRLGEAFANVQLSSIFNLALTLDQLRFSSPELFVTRDEAGNFDFAYLLMSGDKPAEEPKQEDATESSLFQALIYDFAIENMFVNWSDRQPVEPLDERFGPIDISIEELNTLPNRAGRQNVVIVTENTGTLSWSGDLQLNPLQSSGRATLEESRFPLLTAYIRHQTGLEIVEGEAGLALNYRVSTTDDGSLEAQIDDFDLVFSDIVVRSFSDGTGFDFAGQDRQILALPKVELSDGEFQWPQQ